MSLPRSCNSCRSAKTKCDFARPSCSRCARRGQPCLYEADRGLVFRSENDTARLQSNRTRDGGRKTVLLVDDPELLNAANSSSLSEALSLEQTSTNAQSHSKDLLPPLPEQDHTVARFWQQQLPWLNRDAVSEVPEPLKRDLQSRAVDRFFVNWVLYPGNSGLWPGHLHVISELYHAAASDSVLHCAVRALVFADMPKNLKIEESSYHIKAQRSYGLGLARMRELASDEASVVDDHVLAALLLIDNFELMYLARVRPLGSHCDAFKHILRARGNVQLFSGQSFSLWRIAHHRLQAHQISLRQPPDPDQIEWISKLDTNIPSFHISSDILHMSMLAASARQLVQDSQLQWTVLRETLDQTERLTERIRTFLHTLDDWTSNVSATWQPNVVDSTSLQQPEELRQRSPIPAPDQVLQYADSWLAYMWNFHSASQIVLRESYVELIDNTSIGQGNPHSLAERQRQQNAIASLCTTILQGFPPLLGFENGRASEGAPIRQGRMAKKFSALFSMWIVQNATYSLPGQKEQASTVVDWIMSSCKL